MKIKMDGNIRLKIRLIEMKTRNVNFTSISVIFVLINTSSV